MVRGVGVGLAARFGDESLKVLVQDVVERTGLLWPVVAAKARKADMAQVAQEQELGSATRIKSGPFS